MSEDGTNDDPQAAAQWQRIWDVFHEALELPEDQRREFLDRACAGDADLHTRVRKLLAAHFSSDVSVFSDLPSLLTSTQSSVDELDPQPGQSLGPYVLVETAGTGGMGVVYRAEQTEPVRRTVALKLLQLGLATREVMSRFEAERQALAIMNHANIAKVYDAGSTDQGRPYFVMEYVDGQPITEYCDTHQLNIRERLEIFLDVCDGVQHAHQKGVIHRDIKPSNILVFSDAEKAVPKIIDFGIAKALEQPLSEETVHTLHGVMIGTPGYMSPEQAGITGLDVDIRADVYSLGVLLYQLLVGVTPFASLRAGLGLLDLQRAIRDEDATHPATRLDGLESDEVSRICTGRQTGTSSLRRVLSGDISWVALKAMDKNRERRYMSVQEFVADLERYSAGHTVTARAPTRWYRMARFTRRHRIGVAFTIATVLLLVSFAGFMTVQSIKLQQALDESTLERNRAERTSEFMVGLFESANPNVAKGQSLTARDMLQAGSDKLQTELAEQPQLRARLFAAMAEAYRVLGGDGNSSRAAQLLELALADLQGVADGPIDNVAAIHNGIGSVHHDQGEYDLAERHYTEAIKLFREHGGESAADLSNSLLNLASLHNDRGSLNTAAALLLEAIEIREALEGDHAADIARARQRLAYIMNRQGNNEEALPEMLSALAQIRTSYGNDHPYTAVALNYLATIQGANELHDGAQESLREAVKIYKNTHGDEHPYLANTYSNLGLAYNASRNYNEAAAALGEAMRIGTLAYGVDHPSVNSFRVNRGTTLQDVGRFHEAEQLLRVGLRYDREQLDSLSPYLLSTLDRLAGTLDSLGKLEDAERYFEEALGLRREILGDAHTDTGASMLNLALNLLRQNELERAEAMLTQAFDLQSVAEPANEKRLAASIWGLGRLYHAREQFKEAEVQYQLAVRSLDASDSANELTIARIGYHRAQVAEQLDGVESALRQFRELVPVFDEYLHRQHLDRLRLDMSLVRLNCAVNPSAQFMEELEAMRAHFVQGLGKGNWQLALLDSAAGHCLTSIGEFAKAEPRLQASLEMLKTVHGIDHPDTRLIQSRLNRLYDRWSRVGD